MYRNSYNRVVTNHMKQLLVYCDRGDLVKAQSELDQVYQAIDGLMDFTRERMAIKAKREAENDTPESKPQANNEEGEEADSGSKKGSTKASKRVQRKRDDNV